MTAIASKRIVFALARLRSLSLNQAHASRRSRTCWRLRGQVYDELESALLPERLTRLLAEPFIRRVFTSVNISHH